MSKIEEHMMVCYESLYYIILPVILHYITSYIVAPSRYISVVRTQKYKQVPRNLKKKKINHQKVKWCFASCSFDTFLLFTLLFCTIKHVKLFCFHDFSNQKSQIQGWTMHSLEMRRGRLCKTFFFFFIKTFILFSFWHAHAVSIFNMLPST